MNIIDTTVLRTCTNCEDIDDLICAIDKSLSVSATSMLNNARFGLHIPVNRSKDITLLRFRDILASRRFNPQYASAMSTPAIAAAISLIVSSNAVRL